MHLRQANLKLNKKAAVRMRGGLFMAVSAVFREKMGFVWVNVELTCGTIDE